MKINRRQWIAGTVAFGTSAHLSLDSRSQSPESLVDNKVAGAASGPVIHVKRRPVVRVLGTHVTLQEEIRKRAEVELGIRLEFSPGGSAEVLHKASTRPESFDLYEQWSNSIRVLWQANAIQAIDVGRIRYWDEINPLTKTGRLSPEAKLGAGDAPNKILYVQPDGKLGDQTSDKVSFLPYVHNVDSFGYNPLVVPTGKPYVTESWAWLLDEKWAGKVAIVNEPTIGLFDLALAVQAKGLMEFNDIGSLTASELDELFSILVKYRRAGHFRGVWSSVPASVILMKRGEAVIESMFSPAVYDLHAAGIPCVYASPKEGYRAWHGVMCLSSATTGLVKDAAYEYMNWWLSGWPGAFIARQGYYISNPERSRSELSEVEWDYWYLGKPAASDLLGTSGSRVVEKGRIRDGGSYTKRFSNIAVWNTVMNTYEYSLRHWNEFLSA
ncbi:ABC transporter substrate-binding protein [Aporhodopirellula aestuarii]|uniref:Extracellular solute-binding protein n=1 Tax=Aporhodopirellula aestuarii TaxID=2950107 RepID=A0ABT0TZJ0_9BACT|nr:extracellular solute-binding protein [Aporhodopirellula aestuarii]MCM2369911.1 extracellular solute-binding protein [Aporhodopirellula aestuarii]